MEGLLIAALALMGAAGYWVGRASTVWYPYEGRRHDLPPTASTFLVAGNEKETDDEIPPVV